jgi:hypothetical protein
MIEALSYWKATCSPKIEILAGDLNKEQIRWWRNLIFKGMGQFFFENKINFLERNFLKIESFGEKFERFEGKLNENKILVPVGGGKDSVVTIEYLKKMKKDLILFCLNPNENQKKIIEISGIKKKVFR